MGPGSPKTRELLPPGPDQSVEGSSSLFQSTLLSSMSVLLNSGEESFFFFLHFLHFFTWLSPWEEKWLIRLFPMASVVSKSLPEPGTSLLLFLRECVEKAMAPHSSTLAWKIPWMEELGRLKSMGSLRVGHD